jgi:hypothetical protein
MPERLTTALPAMERIGLVARATADCAQDGRGVRWTDPARLVAALAKAWILGSCSSVRRDVAVVP